MWIRHLRRIKRIGRCSQKERLLQKATGCLKSLSTFTIAVSLDNKAFRKNQSRGQPQRRLRNKTAFRGSGLRPILLLSGARSYTRPLYHQRELRQQRRQQTQ